jgi:hypothetical protein
MFVDDRLSLSLRHSVNRRVRGKKGEIMCSRERFLTIGALCVFLASPSVALGQSAQARLAKAKSLKCVFQIVATASWTNGEPRGEIKPTTLSFAFDEIDSDEGTARIIGAFGPSEIIVRLSTGNLHFVQAFREGPLYTTTVFPRETRNGNLQAVHSRHEYTEVSLPGFTSRPEQYYGECAIGP